MSKIPQQLRWLPLDNNQQKYTPFLLICQLARGVVRLGYTESDNFLQPQNYDCRYKEGKKQMKKNHRRMITFIVVMALVFPAFHPVSASYGVEKTDTGVQTQAALHDVAGHWGEGYIKEALAAGFITGYENGTFQPNKEVTRAEFVTMVNKALQLRDENIVSLTFSDVKETDWYYNDIQKASCARYVSGVSDTRFLPDYIITREEAAAMLARLLPKAGYQSEASLAIYPDAADISTWAKAAVAVMMNKGYLKGRANGKLDPSGTLTRAEAVKMIVGMTENETIIREDISLRNSGDILENGIYVGDITIERTVGEGEAVLQNLSALSKVYILGGGVNTVTLRNTTILQLIVGKNGSKVRVLSAEGNLIYDSFVFNGNLLVDSSGQFAETEQGGFRNIVQLNGSISEEDAVRIANEISARLDSTGNVTHEQIIEGVSAILPNATATVNESGSIVATVTEKSRPNSDRSSTQPQPVAVTGITLDPPIIISATNYSENITAVISPGNATNKNVRWTSSDESVATVANGVVTIVRRYAGGGATRATITAITSDGEITATAYVNAVSDADAHAYWTMSQTFDHLINDYENNKDLAIETDLTSVEAMFIKNDGHYIRMSYALPYLPDRAAYLEYHFAPYINKILAARTAFNEVQLGETKALISGAAFTMTQAAATTESAVKAEIEHIVAELSSGSGITTTVNKVAYASAVAGDAGDDAGSNGTYTFTVHLVMDSETYIRPDLITDITANLTMTITATPYIEP